MSEAKHTPGPWHKERYSGTGTPRDWSGWHIKEDASGLTDVAYVDDVDYGPEVAERDANLIAAAPELLAACQAMHVRLFREQGGKENSPWESPLRMLKAAIAKAEGR